MVKDSIIPNHMDVYWHDYTGHVKDRPITETSVPVKAALIGRVGLMLLSCGTGAWRVRNSMNALSEQLGVTCIANIGLLTIVYTCFDGRKTFTNSLCLISTGVNTSKLDRLERFVKRFPDEGVHKTAEELQSELDEIEKIRGRYTPARLGLAAGFACAAFTFLLGGGPIEMGCAFIGAGLGMLTRRLMTERNLTHFACIGVGVTVACLAYLGSLWLLSLALPGAMDHDAGYIGAMLFVIPGFPLITSGLDLAKLDIRSGVERLVYACTVIIVATLVAWLVASVVQLRPDDFAPLGLTPIVLLALRLVASFVGVFGFSVLFNSPARMAATAGVVGAVANTLRLTLVDVVAMPPEAAAFAGAITAGLLATIASAHRGFPRISIRW